MATTVFACVVAALELNETTVDAVSAGMLVGSGYGVSFHCV